MGLFTGIAGTFIKKALNSSKGSSSSHSTFPTNVSSQPRIPRKIQKDINKKTNKFIKEHVSKKLGNTLEKIDEIEDYIHLPEDIQNEASKKVAGLIINLALTKVAKILPGKTPKEIEKSCKEGDHLYVSRDTYTHHALYVGHGNVLHYSNEKIHQRTLEGFADGAEIHQIITPSKYSPDEIVQRGYRRYGEEKYRVLFNNCQQFVEWCRNGD
ncbi:MAG: hypothetical protein H6Q68_3178 [Firmicutes bacterium]|nr:hypothetical protein [Bacillota bacterium]